MEQATTGSAAPVAGGADARFPATAAGATAFVNAAEEQLQRAGEFANRAAWVRATYINEDTQWLETKAGGEYNALASRLARDSARFNSVQGLDPLTRRKLQMLQRALVLPAPSRDGAAEELAALGTKLDSTYSTGKFTYKGKTLTLNDAEDILRTSRDPAELRRSTRAGGTISPPMRDGLRPPRGAGQRGLHRSWATRTPARSGAPGTTWSRRLCGRTPTGSGRGRALLPQPALLRARQAERQVRRRRAAQDRTHPRRPARQHVGPGVGQHL
jgi:hypothetical protein